MWKNITIIVLSVVIVCIGVFDVMLPELLKENVEKYSNNSKALFTISTTDNQVTETYFDSYGRKITEDIVKFENGVSTIREIVEYYKTVVDAKEFVQANPQGYGGKVTQKRNKVVTEMKPKSAYPEMTAEEVATKMRANALNYGHIEI